MGVQCGCSAPPPLWIWGWTLGWIWGCILGWVPSGEHRQVFSLCLLCRVWKRVWIKPQGLASLPAIRGAGEEPAPPHGPETSIPQAVPAGPTGSGLAGCSRPAPLSWLQRQRRLEQRWLQAVHPSPTLCSLQSCLGLAPSPTRTQLSTGVMPGGSGHASTKNGFDSKVGDPRASTKHPGLPAGEAGECQLHDCSDPPFAEWQVPHYSA